MRKFTKLAIAALGVFSLAACDENDSEEAEVEQVVSSSLEYEVTVSNLTNAQPFSPITVLLHDSGEAWEVGVPASDALENLAESGDNSDLISSNFVTSSATNGAVLPFGQSTTVNISNSDGTGNYLTLVTMLVN